MKFFRINQVVVNSRFTKKWIDKEYPCESAVIYPPVDILSFKPKKKENLILYVGRFSQLEQSKRQDILLKAFKKLYDQGGRNWKLILAGGSDVGRTQFVDKLIKDAKSYPVKIIENPQFRQIKDLYAKAKLFWSAAGFGVSEKKEPQKVEHFGIAPVEAMAAGAVPLLYNAGGHKEIVRDGENGFLWSKIESLLEKTTELGKDQKLFNSISIRAKKDSPRYSYDRFAKEVLAVI
jgi:glycosyltransferase involved in cell wall biosynthesis